MNSIMKYRNFNGSASELAKAVIDCAATIGLNIDPEKTNERLIRYYQTKGVLDRPDRNGRDSSYHFRHLIQTLNARRLVTNGLPLSLAIEYNSSLSTAELEAGLTKPLPNAAELLVSKFKEMDSVDGRKSTSQKLQSTRISMSVIDVLTEVKAAKKDLIHEIQSLMQVKNEVQRMRDELIHQQKFYEEGQFKMEDLLNRLHHTTREFEYLIRESIDRNRDLLEINFKQHNELLEKIFLSQELLVDRISTIEKKLAISK